MKKAILFFVVVIVNLFFAKTKCHKLLTNEKWAKNYERKKSESEKEVTKCAHYKTSTKTHIRDFFEKLSKKIDVASFNTIS